MPKEGLCKQEGTISLQSDGERIPRELPKSLQRIPNELSETNRNMRLMKNAFSVCLCRVLSQRLCQMFFSRESQAEATQEAIKTRQDAASLGHFASNRGK